MIEREKYLIYENNLRANLEKKKFRDSFQGDFFGKLNMMTFDYYTLSEVKLYWPLIGEGVLPKVIDRDVCIAILYKIIEERRMFDGYFSQINSDSIGISRQVYKIMLKSAKENIPVEAIAQRIERFRKGRKNSQIFVDLKNIIVEYRAVLSNLGVYDNSIIYELYFNRLIKNSTYKDKVKNRILEFVDCEDTFFLESVSNVYDMGFESYGEMLNGLEQILNELLNERRIDSNEICVIVPVLNDSLSRIIKDISYRLGHNIKCISESKEIGNSDIAISALVALSIYKNCEYIFNEDERFAFIKNIYKDKSPLDIRRNIDKYINEIRKNFIEENFPYEKKYREEEFIKKFYKKVFHSNEEGIRFIDSISEVFKSFKNISGLDNAGFLITDDFKIDFVKKYLGIFTSNKRKLENTYCNPVILVTPDDYSDLEMVKKYKIVLDAKSGLFDDKVETELDCELAYMDDKLLSNLNEENLYGVYKDLLEIKIDKKVKKILKNGWIENEYSSNDVCQNIYLMYSEKSLRGFDQENKFYYRFLELTRK